MQSDIRQMLSWGLYKKDVAWGKRCCPCKEAPVFWSINWTAALFHLLNTLATLGLWAASDNKDQVYQLTETSAPWTNGTGITDCSTVAPSGAYLSFKTADDWCVSRVNAVTSDLSLWWLVIAFHFLSFAFQAIAMMQWRCSCCGLPWIRENYVDEVNEQGTNVLRMIEYSISATLMQIAIALVLGIWQRLVIMGIAFLTVVTMLLGLIAEQLNALSKSNDGTTFDINTMNHIKTLAWAAHFTGWLSMGGAWTILGRQFYYTIQTSANTPPEFVYVVVGVIAVLYAGFGAIQLVQLCLTDDQNSPKLNRAIEMAYTVNSLTSKTFLGWIIFANALGGMAQS